MCGNLFVEMGSARNWDQVMRSGQENPKNILENGDVGWRSGRALQGGSHVPAITSVAPPMSMPSNGRCVGSVGSSNGSNSPQLMRSNGSNSLYSIVRGVKSHLSLRGNTAKKKECEDRRKPCGLGPADMPPFGSHYKGTSLIRKRLPLGPYSSPMRRALRWS